MQVTSTIFVSFALWFCAKYQPMKHRNESGKLVKDTVKLWQSVPLHVVLQCSSRPAGTLLSPSSADSKTPISSCELWYLSQPSTQCCGALYKIASISRYVFKVMSVPGCSGVPVVLHAVLCLCCQSWQVVTATVHQPCSTSVCPLAHITLAPQYCIPSQASAHFVQNQSERHISQHKQCLWKSMYLQVMVV